jgi:exodeoxyribonuclease VII small subunit
MPKKEDNHSFETALEKLEEIISSMEGGETALADLVSKFEEGTKLLHICKSKLNEAELKIEKLNVETGQLEDFEPEAKM